MAGNIKNPAPSAHMRSRDMKQLVGAQTETESRRRGTTLMVPSSKDRIGPATITNLDSWRWNRWNGRWERMDNQFGREGGAMQATLIETS